MTDATDRFLRACRREPVDATPVWFMRQAGRSLPEYRAVREHATLEEIVADAALCAEVTLQPVRRLGVDAAILFADITTPLAGIGLDVEIVEGRGPVIANPVRTASDLEALRPFDPEASVGPLLDAIRLIRREATVPLVGFAGAPFTLASYIVAGSASGDAKALKALLARDRQTVLDLLDRLAAMTLAYVRAQVDAGAQAIQLFDSWVGALGPFEYERTVLPRMRPLLDAIRAMGVPAIHFGTGTAGYLDLVARTGPDVVGLDWRIALDDAWRQIPERAVMGNLDPAVLLGPWDGIAEQASWILDRAAGRAGHVFNLGHGVLPGTDPDHLRRLVDLVHATSARRPVNATPERMPA